MPPFFVVCCNTRLMATKKKTVPEKEQGGEILEKTAKVIGAALGAVAAKTGVAHPEKPPKKRGKLVAKDKRRLPRREKKRAKKAAAKQNATVAGEVRATD